MPWVKMDSGDMDVFRRIAESLEKIATTNINVLSTGYARSPGPYCCGCGTHAVWSKDGLTCPNCNFYDKEEKE